MADGLQMGKMGVAREMEKTDEVVEGGESVDFELMWMGLANTCRGENAEDEGQEEGEIDRSLLLSLSLWSAVRLICNFEKGDAMVIVLVWLLRESRVCDEEGDLTRLKINSRSFWRQVEIIQSGRVDRGVAR